MSFRAGNQGPEMWPACFEVGVAAITYSPLVDIDLSKHRAGEPKELWDRLSPSQKASLRRVAYEMKKGDVIYVKQGPKIVGKGIVKGSYHFDAKGRIRDPYDDPWAHQVPVEWGRDFAEVSILLGAEPLTVKILSEKDLRRLRAAIDDTTRENTQIEALEGDIYKAEAIFRKRNSSVIQAQKANSDYRCEVCDFSFEEAYGAIGREYIIAHHIRPVSSGPSKTTQDDIALLCANCHSMVHRKNPPILVKDLRKQLRDTRAKTS